jgi:hypothetical protein
MDQPARPIRWRFVAAGFALGLAVAVLAVWLLGVISADLTNGHLSCMAQDPDKQGRFVIAPEPDAGSGCTDGDLCVKQTVVMFEDRLSVTDCRGTGVFPAEEMP